MEKIVHVHHMTNMSTSEYKILWSYEINKLEKVFLATYYYVYPLCLISDQEKKEDLYKEKKYFYCMSNKPAP